MRKNGFLFSAFEQAASCTVINLVKFFILTLFPYRIEYLRNLPIKGRIMSVTNAITKAALVHHDLHQEDECKSLYPGSDFINLTKLGLLMLAKKMEENESQTLTLKGCVTYHIPMIC